MHKLIYISTEDKDFADALRKESGMAYSKRCDGFICQEKHIRRSMKNTDLAEKMGMGLKIFQLESLVDLLNCNWEGESIVIRSGYGSHEEIEHDLSGDCELVLERCIRTMIMSRLIKMYKNYLQHRTGIYSS